jgi:hypothetical protein
MRFSWDKIDSNAKKKTVKVGKFRCKDMHEYFIHEIFIMKL